MSDIDSATLYDRIGGEEGIKKWVHAFYERILEDPDLGPFFKEVPMSKLRRMQLEFFSAALDGPITYSGKPLGHVHSGRGITTKHFARFVEHMLETLKTFDLSEEEIQDVISRVDTYADEITGQSGGVDG